MSFLFASQAQAATYQVDPKHSFILFKVSHLGIGQVVGRFGELSGELEYDVKKPSKSAIRLSVNTKSLDTNDFKRDQHLKSKDFFDVNRHFLATFKSVKVKLEEDKGKMQGELSLLGKKKKIDVEIYKLGEGEDPWGGYRVGFKGHAQIDRRDFGMDYNLGESAFLVDLEVIIEGIRE